MGYSDANSADRTAERLSYVIWISFPASKKTWINQHLPGGDKHSVLNPSKYAFRLFCIRWYFPFVCINRQTRENNYWSLRPRFVSINGLKKKPKNYMIIYFLLTITLRYPNAFMLARYEHVLLLLYAIPPDKLSISIHNSWNVRFHEHIFNLNITNNVQI